MYPCIQVPILSLSTNFIPNTDWQRTGLHIIVLLKRLRCIYYNYTVCYGSIIFYKATTLIKSIQRQRFQYTIFIHKRQRMQ